MAMWGHQAAFHGDVVVEEAGETLMERTGHVGDRWSTGGGDTGLDDLVGFGDMRAGGRGGELASFSDLGPYVFVGIVSTEGQGPITGWGVSDLGAGPGFGAPAFHRGSGAGLGGLGGFGGVHFADAESEDEDWWGGWEAEDEGELGEWKWAMVVVKEGEHKKKTGIVTAIHGHCPRHKHPLEKMKEDDDPFEDEKPKEEDKKPKKKKGPRLECEMCKAAKKKDKDAKPEDDGKPKPVAFGCEDCNWYVCADCHGKKGEKQWQCMLQVDIREGMEVHRDWFNVDHLRLFAEAEDDMDLEDEEENVDVNLAKKFYPDLIEGQQIKASLSSAGRWGFTQRFMYDAVVSRVQDDGNYDIKFHDQLLGEKNGMPIEELESLLTFEASGLGLDPSRYLAMPLEGLAPGGAGSGEDHVKYTLTLELKLPVQRHCRFQKRTLDIIIIIIIIIATITIIQSCDAARRSYPS
ncbi:unnamed protein product [Symbiodinium sp. CCMP2456]|nr:unnamed protein product [Symbiodinium sp. CCMP2456]